MLYDPVGLSSHALPIEHMILIEALLDCAVGQNDLPLAIEFVVLELAFFHGSVHKYLFALSMKLVAFKYTFLESFLVYVHTESIKTILAIIVSYHLTSKGSLLFLRVVNYPYAAYVYLLIVFLSIFNCH